MHVSGALKAVPSPCKAISFTYIREYQNSHFQYCPGNQRSVTRYSSKSSIENPEYSADSEGFHPCMPYEHVSMPTLGCCASKSRRCRPLNSAHGDCSASASAAFPGQESKLQLVESVWPPGNCCWATPKAGLCSAGCSISEGCAVLAAKEFKGKTG